MPHLLLPHLALSFESAYRQKWLNRWFYGNLNAFFFFHDDNYIIILFFVHGNFCVLTWKYDRKFGKLLVFPRKTGKRKASANKECCSNNQKGDPQLKIFQFRSSTRTTSKIPLSFKVDQAFNCIFDFIFSNFEKHEMSFNNVNNDKKI